ncbi:MAG TPA: hypothetical protein VMT27_00005, partial [Actinomycetes bacterium]|nr:hypothetical protein [Actinomycetes bacterium]
MRFSGRVLASMGVLAVASLAIGLLPMSAAMAVGSPPTGLAPDDANTWAKNVVLTWDEVPGASGYQVAISSDGFGTDGDVLTASTTSNRYAPPVALPRGDYEWRVRATLSTGQTDWSGTANLLRGWDPSIAPTLSSLDPGNINDWSVSWTAVPDASFYEVEVSPVATEGENVTDPTYARADTITCFTTHTTWVPSLAEQPGEPSIADGANCDGSFEVATDYSVRVRGRDGSVDGATTPFPIPTNSCNGVWQSVVGETTDGTVPECTGWSDTVTRQVV